MFLCGVWSTCSSVLTGSNCGYIHSLILQQLFLLYFSNPYLRENNGPSVLIYIKNCFFFKLRIYISVHTLILKLIYKIFISDFKHLKEPGLGKPYLVMCQQTPKKVEVIDHGERWKKGEDVIQLYMHYA